MSEGGVRSLVECPSPPPPPPPLTDHLSWVKGLHRAALHEEHVDEVDEHTGSVLGVSRSEDDPLVDDHKHEVAEETQEEEQLREEDQVQAVLLPEVPVGVVGQRENFI